MRKDDWIGPNRKGETHSGNPPPIA
jgi:hypothetical protein